MPEHILPPAPETVFCAKCLRDVVIAATSDRGMDSEGTIADCPIRNDPESQPGELWGTLISFAAPSEISQEGRIERFARWEKHGVEAIKADLSVGPQAAQSLAWEWLDSKESPATQESPPNSKPGELLSLKPGMWGVSIDLKELWRRGRRWLSRNR
jgi:hypothetical protein